MYCATAAFCLLLAGGALAIPVDNLIFFGTSWGDSVLPACDDCYGHIHIPNSLPGLPFYNSSFRDAYVSNNGYIQFGVPPAPGFTPVPNNDIRQLTHAVNAPFYANVDTRGHTVNPRFNKVYYGLRSGPYQMNLLENIIGNYFDGPFNFQYAIVATWYQVGTVNKTIHPTNSFQTTMATDGTKTYLIWDFVDNEINWFYDGDGNIEITGLVNGPGWAQLGDTQAQFPVDTEVSGTPGRFILEVSTNTFAPTFPISNCVNDAYGVVYSCDFREEIIVPPPNIYGERRLRGLSHARGKAMADEAAKLVSDAVKDGAQAPE